MANALRLAPALERVRPYPAIEPCRADLAAGPLNGAKDCVVESETARPFFARHEFLIRRLHSLTGLIPVGAYMCIHLATNASILAGPATFQDNVDRIHSLGPALPFVEWTFILLPIIFHAVVGVAIIRSGLPNTGSYPYPTNVRYTLQRATAWIALFFIGWHVFHMHGWVTLPHWREQVARTGLGAQFDPEHASSSVHTALGSLWVTIFYLVGVAACVFHFANGLWTMGITWGAWTSPAAQKRAGRICLAVGILVMAVGLGALVGVRAVNARAARKLEDARLQWKHLLAEPPVVPEGASGGGSNELSNKQASGVRRPAQGLSSGSGRSVEGAAAGRAASDTVAAAGGDQ